MNDIAVVVTCHAPYIDWLPEAMASIEQQRPYVKERVVVFDDCQPTEQGMNGWQCVQGQWNHPSRARNAGLAATRAPWVIFWDADNIMARGYIAAMLGAIHRASIDTAIIYPNIYYCDEQMRPKWLWQLPPWDYWELRAENCIDTAAAWRRSALDIVGGWSDRTFAFVDYVLALEITALGWKATKLNGPPILKRVHPQGRQVQQQRQNSVLNDLWQARSLAIVSLLAGREDIFDNWQHFLSQAELPPKTSLYVLDNSGRPDFNRRVLDTCYKIATERSLENLNVAFSGQAYRPSNGEVYLERSRHLHVAHLYSSVFARINEDLILTLEDDIEPPLNAARILGEEIGYRSRGKIGAVAGAYISPSNRDAVCAAGFGGYGWGTGIWWNQLPHKIMDVQSVGGGCTMWANWALRDYPIHLKWEAQMGWDGVLSAAVRRNGYRVQLHGGVRCLHHIHGQRVAK